MDIVDIVLAKALAGGGGGGSGLPPIGTTTTTILAEQTLSFSELHGSYMSLLSDFTIVEGDAYDVKFDSTNVTLTAGALTEPAPMQYIGNAALIGTGGTDTGEAFVIFNDGYGTYWVTSDTSATHVCGISQSSQSPVDGTALSVQNGAWAASGAVLPEISGSPQTPADGSIMQVVNGAWQPVALRLPFEVTISAGKGGTYTCDKTYAEIVAAYDANTPIDATVYINGNVWAKIAAYANGSSFYFYSFEYIGAGLQVYQFALNSSDVITESYMTISGTWQS